MGLVGPSCCFIQSRLDESGVCSALHKLREIKKGKKKKVKVTNKHKKYVHNNNTTNRFYFFFVLFSFSNQFLFFFFRFCFSLNCLKINFKNVIDTTHFHSRLMRRVSSQRSGTMYNNINEQQQQQPPTTRALQVRVCLFSLPVSYCVYMESRLLYTCQ